jgi:clorobiocin biosynthesis protein CloN6
MDQQIASRLEADLFLLHAPSVYDFREHDDMLFAYLNDSDSVNVASVYEMYPSAGSRSSNGWRTTGLTRKS